MRFSTVLLFLSWIPALYFSIRDFFRGVSDTVVLPIDMQTPFILGFIPVIFALASLFLAWKEARKENTLHGPLVKVILASVFFLWHLSTVFHSHPETLYTMVFQGCAYSVPYFISFWIKFNVMIKAASVYTIVAVIAFVWSQVARMKRDRQLTASAGFLLSGTGLAMVSGIFVLTQLLTATHSKHVCLSILSVSFIRVTGPLLVIGILLAIAGMVLWRPVVQKAGIGLSLLAMFLYFALFKGFWPLEDPSYHILMGVFRKTAAKEDGGAQSKEIHKKIAYYIALIELGRDAVPLAIQTMEDKNEKQGVRHIAMDLIFSNRDKRGVKPLLAILEGDDEFFRGQAASVLLEIVPEQGVEPVINALEKNRLPWHVLYSIERCGDRRFIQPLLDALEDPARSKSYKLEVVTTLTSFETPEVVNALIHTLEIEKDHEMIKEIVFTLISITDQRITDRKPEEMYNWWKEWWIENKRDFILRDIKRRHRDGS